MEIPLKGPEQSSHVNLDSVTLSYLLSINDTSLDFSGSLARVIMIFMVGSPKDNLICSGSMGQVKISFLYLDVCGRFVKVFSPSVFWHCFQGVIGSFFLSFLINMIT